MNTRIFTIGSILCCLIWGHTLSAQWTDETSFGQIIMGLQSFDNKLFITGGFTKREGNTCYWSAYYNGTSFTNQTALLGGGGLRKMDVYNGELYATGSLDMSAVVKWNGSGWTAAGIFNSSHSGILATGNDLYVGSDFSVVSHKAGTGAFTALPSFDNTGDNINSLAMYNGNLIAGGWLRTYNATSLNNIAQWDGTAWQPLGGGVSNPIRCMAVLNGELYVGGSFATAGGQAAKYIAKWDGTNWSDVGGSVTVAGGNGIRDMIVYNNVLIVVGDFTEIGGVATRNVAMWDGTAWSSLDLATSSRFANCVEVYDGRLYVGTFDFSEAHLYSRELTTIGVDLLQAPAFKLDVYPNPTAGLVNVTLKEAQSTDPTVAIEVFNALGSCVLARTDSADEPIQLNLSNQAKGMYFVKVTSGNKTSTQKVILN